MKKATFQLFFLMLSFTALLSQNLVPNGNFRKNIKCPSGTSDYTNTPPWFVPENHTGTPDYFSVCSEKKGGQDKFYEPYKYLSDSAFYGFIAYYNSGEVREYLTAPLSQPLEKGRKYVAGFKVCLSYKFEYAVDHMGLYFSEEKLRTKNNYEPLTQYKPQVDNPRGHALANDSQWVLVADTFIAKGGEKFVTIGNFFSDKQIKITTLDGNRPNGWAYYFVTDVFAVPGELYVPETEKPGEIKTPEGISTTNKETTRNTSNAEQQKK